MSVTDKNIVDAIAYDENILIMEIYDHLPFDDKFEFDHLTILQDKLNTYMSYINSKQYKDVYPGQNFSRIVINIHFRLKPTNNCKKFISSLNQQLSGTNILIIPYYGERVVLIT